MANDTDVNSFQQVFQNATRETYDIEADPNNIKDDAATQTAQIMAPMFFQFVQDMINQFAASADSIGPILQRLQALEQKTGVSGSNS